MSKNGSLLMSKKGSLLYNLPNICSFSLILKMGILDPVMRISDEQEPSKTVIWPNLEQNMIKKGLDRDGLENQV